MKVTRTHEFAAPIDRCWAMFHDPDSHVAKFTAMGHRDVQIVECDRSDDRLHLVIERMVDVDVPGFARKVIQPSNRLRSVDEWRRLDDQRCGGEFVLSTQGVPIDITGRTVLTADGDRCHYEIDVELKVRVPLIGGRIADFSKGIIDQQLTDEFRLGDEWLVAHP
jgi:hypothetical protein